MNVTKESVSKMFEYRGGNLYWKIDRKKVKTGQKAGRQKSNGYCEVRFNGKLHGTHRLIFMMFHGYMPGIVDHIDGNPSNNLIENLREATHKENIRNSKIPKDNTSGFKGVTKNKGDTKWTAQCVVDGKRHYLGQYADIHDAAEVVKNFREEKHGEFCRHN